MDQFLQILVLLHQVQLQLLLQVFRVIIVTTMQQEYSPSESWHLQQPGPSLSSCKAHPHSTIFVDSSTSGNVLFQKDIHSNVRAYYYSLLCLVYQNNEPSLSSRILHNFKNILYDEQTKPDQFQIPALKSSYKEFYNNVSLKKLIGEFLQELDARRGKGVVRRVVNEHPIMDLVMMLLVRSVICYHRQASMPVSERLATRTIAECFWELFEVGSVEVKPSVWVFEGLEVAFRSQGAYEEIGAVEVEIEEVSQNLSKSLTRCKKLRRESFETIIEQPSKQDSDYSQSEQIQRIRAQIRNGSVTSSFDSIHLKLKGLQLDECLSEITKRQSNEEDSFFDRTNMLSESGEFFKATKTEDSCFENREPNSQTPTFKLKKKNSSRF